jgi:hypothetical protein
MSDRFSGLRINIKFFTKLENSTRDTCAMLSETYVGEKLWKIKML